MKKVIRNILKICSRVLLGAIFFTGIIIIGMLITFFLDWISNFKIIEILITGILLLIVIPINLLMLYCTGDNIIEIIKNKLQK
jgi:hypothetical protein